MTDPLRNPEHLHPLLIPLWTRFMRLARGAGLVPRLTFTYRSRAEQERLFQIGRRGIPGERIVTHAQGGQSWHNVEREGKPAALAFDAALLTADGKAMLPSSDPAWVVAGEIGEGLGLTWGGRWTMRDLGHFQFDNHGHLALQEAMQGVDPEEERG